MSSSNLIQFQQIQEPSDLKFVFPLSRYNQQVFGVKNNFITYNFDLNYNFVKFYDDKIGLDLGIGYLSTLNSIYKKANWSFKGYNFNLGIKYYYNDNRISYQNNLQTQKQILITDTTITNDTINIKEITTKESLNNTFQLKFAKSDTTQNIKNTEDYILKIINIKNTFHKIEYQKDKSLELSFKNLIIPNLDLFYSYNNILTKNYYNKINKQITKYNYLIINENELNELLNFISYSKDNLDKNLTLKNTILKDKLNVIDTIVTINFPNILFKLDIYSEETITNCKIIISAINDNIKYKDTLVFDQYVNNKVDINYIFNLNKLEFTNDYFKKVFDNQITTNYIFGDFMFKYEVIIEDISGNTDNTLNGNILFETIYNKIDKINDRNILLIDFDNKNINDIIFLNNEHKKLFEANFKDILTNIQKFKNYKVYELID